MGGKSGDPSFDVLADWPISNEGGCALKPVQHARGPNPLPLNANPLFSTDQDVIRFLSSWMLPPMFSKAEIESYNLACFERDVRLIEAAYVAIYEPYPGGPETGVFGLQFREPLTREMRARLELNETILSGRLAVLVWTDSEDRSCYEAVRAHVEKCLARAGG